MPNSLIALLISATVVSVGDGDTLRANIQGKPTTIRLACVDAMERRQPGGTAATSTLKSLLPPGSAIAIDPIAKDRYGRTVAKVSVGGVLVNLQMVELGQALIYPKYFKPCQDQEQQFNQAQQKARSRFLGFWGLPSEQQVFPWEFRKK